MRRSIGMVAAAAALAVGSHTARAQFIPRTPPPSVPQLSGMIGIDPGFIAVNVFSLEAEGVTIPGSTLGASVSYSDLGRNTGIFSTAEAKYRFYTSGYAFDGAAIGLGLGVTRIERPCCGDDTPRTTIDMPTVGILFDYDIAMGRDRRFIMGFGAEGKRLIATDADRNSVNMPPAYVSARFVFGYAF